MGSSPASERARWRRSGSVAEILLISDEESCEYYPFRSPALAECLLPVQHRFLALGAPVDHVLLRNLGAIDATRYKLVVVLNAARVDDGRGRAARAHKPQAAAHDALVPCARLLPRRRPGPRSDAQADGPRHRAVRGGGGEPPHRLSRGCAGGSRVVCRRGDVNRHPLWRLWSQ